MAKEPRCGSDRFGVQGWVRISGQYIYELLKLQNPELSTSAVNCGNWMAQVRQILVGLSPTASTWWGAVELVANAQYQRWLTP